MKRKTRIIIVDDSLEICDALKDIFIEENYEVSVAHDGLEFFALLNNIIPDVILLDLMMPRVNGFEVLTFLKISRFKDIPVIVISASNVSTSLCIGYPVLEKPILLESLLSKLKEMEGQRPKISMSFVKTDI